MHFRRAAGSPNTMWPGPRSTSIPSGVFIHGRVADQRLTSTTHQLLTNDPPVTDIQLTSD